jgi:hypothetical protein
VRAACHQLTHVIGRTRVELYGDLPGAYAHGEPARYSGYYHGVTEVVMARVGTDEVLEEADEICAGPRERWRHSIPSPCLWPPERLPVAALRAGCRRAWVDVSESPTDHKRFLWTGREFLPQPQRREPLARRWRWDAPPHRVLRRPSGPVRQPPGALGSAPAGCAGWLTWSWDGTHFSSARRFRSSLICAFVGVNDSRVG